MPQSKKRSLSSRAGLVFPCGRLRRHLQKGRFAPRVGKGAPIYLAGVLEYLCAEILELAGNQAKEGKKKRIVPRHIMLAVRQDSDFERFLRDVSFPYSGVQVSIIQPELLRVRRSDKHKTKEKSRNDVRSEDVTEDW